VTLRCLTALPACTAVRVDVEGALVLGEVVHSSEEGDGWTVIVSIDQVIPSLPDLVNLVQGVFGAAPAEKPMPAR
jgi:hypothetical protein